MYPNGGVQSTLPLVKIGYQVTLSDISSGLLSVARVLKKRGKILVDAIGRHYTALHRFEDDPGIAVKMVKSEFDGSPWGRIFGLEEFREMFEDRGIRVLTIYGGSSPDGLGVLDLLPREVIEAREQLYIS
jgi:hypothetical protein